MDRFLLKFVFIGLVVFHLGMTILYLLPNNPGTKYYQSFSRTYMDPIFTQNWKLFSPDPVVYNLKLFYRCKTTNDLWSPWQDPVAMLVQSHQDNRLLFKGKLIYVYHGLYRNLLNKNATSMETTKCKRDDALCEIKRKQEIAKTAEAQIVTRFVATVCKRQNHLATNEFRIIKEYPKKFSERHLENANQPIQIAFESREFYAVQ